MESYKEIESYYSREGTDNLSEYEKDHKPRLDYLIADLNLNTITDSKICDFGAGGGYIVVEGTPEKIARTRASETGKALKPVLVQAKELASKNKTGKRRPVRKSSVVTPAAIERAV